MLNNVLQPVIEKKVLKKNSAWLVYIFQSTAGSSSLGLFHFRVLALETNLNKLLYGKLTHGQLYWLTQVLGRLTGTYRVYAMAATQRPPTFVVLVMGNLMAHITGTTGIFVFFRVNEYILSKFCYWPNSFWTNFCFDEKVFNNFMILM